MDLKSAYELAQERMVVSRNKPSFEGEPEEEGLGEDFFVPLDNLKYPEDLKDKKESGDIKMVSYPKTSIPEMKDLLQVHWNGNFLDYGGFARMNRAFAFGLADRNVLVKTEIADYTEHVNESTKNLLKTMSNNRVPEDAPKIFGVTIPINPSHGGKKIYYTMMETSEKVHKDYAEKLNLANEVWVPTSYGKKIMENSGVQVPIYVMPLGVDTNRYQPQLAPLPIRKQLNGFVFVSVFRWGYRKGYDVLLQSYLEEFSKSDDVSLLIVSRPVDCMEEVGDEKIADSFNIIKDSVKKDDYPHVALYTKPIPEKDMPNVYSTGDAFVLISRGEGFGLPYCEAGSCEIPIIASSCSGHSDFLNDETAFVVKPDDFLVSRRTDPPFRNMSKICRFYEDQLFPEFKRPAIDQIKTHMRFVFENRDNNKVSSKVRKFKSIINKNYTWDKAVDRVYDRISQIKKGEQ